MISRFFLSFFRAYSLHLTRMGMVLFLTSIAFLLVGAITTLVESRIQSETRTLLGADITLESNQRPSDSDREFLRQLSETFDIEIASSIDFQTNLILENGEILLSDIKIISQNFPLTGEPFVASGTGVYISDALESSLGNIGSLTIGENVYQIDGKIPPSTFGGFSLFTEGRELWILEDYVETRELLGLGARVEYEYFINTQNSDIATIKEYIENEDGLDAWRVRDIASRQDRVSDVFAELQKFLQVFFVGIYVLAFFSLFFTFEALKRITRRDIGLFVLLGYTKRKVFSTLAFLLVCIYVMAFFLAYLASLLLVYTLTSFPLTESLSLSFSQIIQSFILSGVILCSALYAPTLDSLKSSTLELLKKSDSHQSYAIPLPMIISLMIGIILLLLFLGASTSMIFIVSISFVGVFFLLAGIVRIYFLFFYTLSKGFRKKYFLLFHTIRSCVRPGNMTLFIILPVMIIGTVFFFFVVFALTFLDATRVPENSGTYFVLNIGESEKESLENSLEDIQIYDILLGRIISINNTPLCEFLPDTPGRGEFTREFNITTHPLPDNLYEVGKELTENGVSLDTEFAQRLGVGLGDDIRFLLAGREVSFVVQNLRPAVRGDFLPFFYFQLRAEDLSGLERSYFATLSDTLLSQSELQSQLFSISPRLQLIDISETLREVSRILGQVYQGVFFMTLYVGIFVSLLLSVSLTILSYIRKKEAKILSLLGASKRFCNNNLAFEYLLLLSFACIGIILIGSVLSIWFFYSLSFLDLQFFTLLQASAIILFGAFFLFITLSIRSFIKR